jgi:hypothetical protein
MSYVHEGLKGSYPCSRCDRVVFAVRSRSPELPERLQPKDGREVVMLIGPARVSGYIVALFPRSVSPTLVVVCAGCRAEARNCSGCAGAGCPACCTVCDGEGGPAPVGCPGCNCYDRASDEAEADEWEEQRKREVAMGTPPGVPVA